jgi:dolichol kinase
LRDRGLGELVRRTKGLQPWRRLFHVTNGVVVVLVMEAVPIATRTAVIVLGAVCLALGLLDVIRLTNRGMNRRFFRLFSFLASPREARGVASSTWYAIGVVLTLLVFPRQEALAGILVLALADPVAGFVGRIWGRHRLGRGTWEGTLSFTAVAFLALLLYVPWWAALGTALATAWVEQVPWSLDDNLVIPPTVAALLLLLVR